MILFKSVGLISDSVEEYEHSSGKLVIWYILCLSTMGENLLNLMLMFYAIFMQFFFYYYFFNSRPCLGIFVLTFQCSMLLSLTLRLYCHLARDEYCLLVTFIFLVLFPWRTMHLSNHLSIYINIYVYSSSISYVKGFTFDDW